MQLWSIDHKTFKDSVSHEIHETNKWMNELKKANKSKIKCKELGKKLKQGRYKKKMSKICN